MLRRLDAPHDILTLPFLVRYFGRKWRAWPDHAQASASNTSRVEPFITITSSAILLRTRRSLGRIWAESYVQRSAEHN